MTKKLMMLCVAAIAATGVWADFVCSAEVGEVNSATGKREGTVTWKNTGSSGLAAPYVRLTAGDGVLIRLTDADAWGKSIEFLATSTSLPASTLKAGEEGALVFSCLSESDDGKLELSWTLASAEAFPWSELGASLKPSYVSQDAWTFALSTLKTRFGTTWDTYLTRLRANADYLAGLGRPVNRIDRLMQIEIGRALGVDAALPVLDSVTDAARSARGLSLAFSRTYSSAMYSRFTSGILGYGWTDNYSAYAELTDDKTLVFRLPGGGSYSFTKETGSWQPEDARDKTILSESSSAYTLTYQNGTVQTFAKSNMRIASIADNSGNAVTFTWNGTNLMKATHTDGQSLIFDYSNGLLSSVTDDCGRKTQYTYSNSLLTKVISPDGLTVSYEYRPVDNTAVSRALSRIVYPDGTTREFTYDTSSGLISEVSVNGGKEKTTIARTDSVVTLTSVDGAVTTIKTGVSGEVLETVDALGGVTAREYTEDGLLKAIVSPSGLAGSITHDTLGRVSKSASAAGTETAFSYESTFGNLKAVTDAKNHAITYGYDSKGCGTSVSFVDESSSKLEYNDRGDIVKSTNRRGESITYQYDSMGRLTKKTWGNGRTFTYDYDARGNITTASDSETGTVTMRYDSVDRIIKIVYPTGRGFTFVYDSCGRLSSRASIDGSEECFTYDASGRIATVTDGKDMVYLKNSYDATTGRLTKQENGNGTSVSYLYDKLGRIVSIEHRDATDKIVESLQYCYDADGRCIRAASLLGEERYGYDKDGQLTSVEYHDDTEEAFVYDAVGNRVSRTGGSPAENETYAVNNLNQYTEIVNAQAARSKMTYDRDGNMTAMTDSQGTTRYYYDTLNRLVAVTNATKNIRWSCVYDVFGNRVSVTDNGVTTERTYLQGSLPSVAAEYVNGELKERHILVGAVRVADLITNHSSLTTKYYHADLIGSTRLVTDGNGAIVDRRAYRVFGETRIGGSSSSTTDTAGYVGTLGVETDSTGLLFMRNRYYSPSLGRFIQMDPIGLDGEDVNLYRYCENNSILSCDPIGLFSVRKVFGKMLFDDPLSSENMVGVSSSIGESVYDNADKVSRLFYYKGRGRPSSVYNQAKSVINSGKNLHSKNWFPALSIGSSYMSMYNSAQAGDPEGVVAAWVKGSLSAIPYVREVIAAWDAGVMLGSAVASVVYWFSGSQRELERSYERAMRNVRLEEMQSCIVLIRPDGGGGSDGDGDGVIKNQDDWLKISALNGGSSATYSLGADITIDLSKSGYLEIGGAKYAYSLCQMSSFSGKIKGNGHKITIKGSALFGDFLFHEANGATFEDVTSIGCFIREATSCEFTDCKIDTHPIVITAEDCSFGNCGGVANMSPVQFGGLVFMGSGALVCEVKNCTFTDCNISGIVKTADTREGSGGTGALVGISEGCRFVNCQSLAIVKDESSSSAGGLVGKSTNSEFMNCSTRGEVTGSKFVGGFVGYSSNDRYSSCLADVSVTGGDSLGGFSGQLHGGIVASCSAAGKVVCDSTLSGASGDIGGFSGLVNEGAIEKSMASCDVSALGSDEVGGFAGCIDDAKIQKCYASGNVTGGSFVGGFVGSMVSGATYNCYATGAVSATGGTSDSAYAGGFAGQAIRVQGSGADCQYCYSSGRTTASGGNQMTTIAGGFAPLSIPDSQADAMSSYISMLMSESVACYWNVTSTGCKYSNMGTGLAAANAKKQSSYSGWDFVNTWKMGSNGPELRDVGPLLAASAASVRTAACISASQGEAEEDALGETFNEMPVSSVSNLNGGDPAGRSPVRLQGASADGNLPLMSATSTRAVSSRATATSPRLYCYERYVAVAGYAYEFNLSTEAEASITVSGLPKGLVYSNGIISGTPIRSETSILTITARFSNSIQTKNVPFVVIETPEDMILPGVSVIVDERCEGWGEVSGSMIASPGTQVALRAMANNGYIFAGWYMMDGLPFNGLVDYRTPNLAYEVTEKHITLVARFVQSANDVASVMFELPNELSTGVPIEPVAIDVSGCTSLPTVKVTGLPEGLKFTAKDVFKTGSKTEVEYPANTIYGTPTRSGVYTIAATVTTAGKKMATYSQTVIVRMDGEKVVVAECDAIGGKVTGGGVYAEGKSAALKATANKGYVFAGWYEDNAFTTPCDSTLADYRNPSYAYTMGADDKTLHARFELVEADTNLSLTVDGVAITLEDSPFNSFTVGSATNLPIVLDSFSLPKAAVKGLPAGMKYTEKPIFVKGSKTEIETPANSIYGAPTKPGVYKVSVSLTNTSIKKAVVNEFEIVVPNLMDDLIVVDDEYGPYVPGVAYTNTISAAAGCAVTGLPADMKWTAKDILDSKTKQVAVSANSAYGVPTKPGKYTVYFTKTVDNVKHTATATFVVGDFPVVDVEIIGNGTGKVTGAGAFAANKKVTLKATADTKDDAKKGTKKSVFAGWYLDQNGDHPVVSSVDFRTPSLSYVMTAEPQTRLYAKFVTAEEDAASIALSVDALGGAISPEAIVSVTNTCGVALKWSVAADALSQPLVAVSGLPSGLKFTAKDIMKKGSKTEVEIPANTIYGVPTAASKIDKKTGLPIPSVVKIMVTTAGKSSVTYLVNIVVDSLPAWAVGNFEGFVRHDEDDGGFASMSVTTAGKISGKIAYGGTNWTFKAASYDIASETVGYTNFAVKAVAASGKATLDFSLAITKDGVDYLPDSAVAFGDGNFGDMPAEMHRLPWKDKNDTDAASLIASYAGAYSCKVPYGRDAAGVTFVLDEKGAVKGTVVLPDGTKTRKATFSCNVLPNYDSLSVVIALPPDFKKGYPAVFKIVELVNCSGEGSDGMAYRDPGVIVNVDEYFTGSGATGTVSVSPKYGQVSSGKSVTITAKPAKGSVFHCWKIKGVGTDGLNLTEPTLKFVMPGESDVYATAVFATVEDDIVSFSLDVPPSRMVEPGGMFLINLTDYVNSLSRPQVTVKGLPSGLKYDPKTMTISGSITKNGKYTVMLTGTNASVTGKNAIVGEFVIIVQESEVDTKYTSISDFEWVYTSCGVEITSYLGDDYNVNIPPIIDNLPVVSIGAWSFFGCASLESVHIPDSVTSIGVGAFDDCPCLVSINIPKGVSVIEGCLFSKCHSLKRIVIPEGVTSIGESAFYHCTSLTELMIPNSVTNIDSCAFADCSSLTNVTKIGNATIRVGSGVFYGCPGLIDSDGFVIAMGVVCGYSGEGGDIVIPDGVESIAEGVFDGCSSLRSILIPDSVVSIGEFAFWGCSGLADDDGFVIVKNVLFGYFGAGGDVLIPQGVTRIGAWAFLSEEDGNIEINSITIPDSVVSIGEGAFESCSSLRSINIPDSVISIEWGAFARCSSLVEVFFEGDAPVLEDSIFYDVNENCTAYVRPGSIGWGVTIPGVWNNIYITYEALR